MAEQVASQSRDDPIGRRLRVQVAHAVQRGPHHDGDPDEHDGRHHRVERRVLQERAVHHVGEGDSLHHDGHCADCADDQRDGCTPPQARHARRQLGVDQARPDRARESGAQSLNVVSFTSTERPMRPSVTASRAVAASSQVAAVRTPSGRSATMAARTGSSLLSPP